MKHIQTMTYDQKSPNVCIITQKYDKGVRVSADYIEVFEDALDRVAGLEKWFVRIEPQKSRHIVEFMD